MKFGPQRFGSALLACRLVQKRMTSRNMACWFRSRRSSCRIMSRFQASGLRQAAAAMATCFDRRRSSEVGLQLLLRSTECSHRFSHFVAALFVCFPFSLFFLTPSHVGGAREKEPASTNQSPPSALAV